MNNPHSTCTEYIDCAACESVCPMEAIRPDRLLPQEWAVFRDVAQDLFRNGAPADDSAVRDPEIIARWQK
jgi:ferredoxin